MIIANGTIEFKQKPAYTRNSIGEFVFTGKASWGKEIACQYYANGGTLQSRDASGNPVTQLSWTILIEEQPIVGEQVRLKDAQGNNVGEYSILRHEPLQAVGQIRILV